VSSAPGLGVPGSSRAQQRGLVDGTQAYSPAHFNHTEASTSVPSSSSSAPVSTSWTSLLPSPSSLSYSTTPLSSTLSTYSPTTSLSSAGGHVQDSAVDDAVHRHAIDPSTAVATAPLGTSARALYVEVVTPQAPASNAFPLWPSPAAAVPGPSGHGDLYLPYRQDTLQSVRNNILASAAPQTVSPEGHHQGSRIDDAMAAVATAPGGTSMRESLARQLAKEGPVQSYRSDPSLRYREDTVQSIVNDTVHSAAAPHPVPPPMGADACDRMSPLVHEISIEEWRQLVAELNSQSNVNDIKRVLQKTAEKAWHHLRAIEPDVDHSAARTRSGRRESRREC
jgi:hypothetical protein